MKVTSLTCFLTVLALFSTAAQAKDWRFTVYLDDDEIGYHNFLVKEQGDTITADIQAEFKVKVLLVTAYAYSHENREVYKGNCLQRITSTTNDNGDKFTVSGRLEGGKFEVATNKGGASLPACIMTFAYWNPAILQQQQLLNSQTGEYITVNIKGLGREDITIRGQTLSANKYILSGQGLDPIELWYSPDGEWLRLESTTGDGYRIIYDLQ